MPAIKRAAVVGHQLLKVDLRTSMSAPTTTTLHSQPEGRLLLSLAVFPHPSPFVALATSRHVILLDARRPRSALLKWDHCELPPPSPLWRGWTPPAVQNTPPVPTIPSRESIR